MNEDTQKYLYVPDEMMYGVGRRKFIMDWFVNNPSGMYAINCHHRPQLWHDPDLRKLVKQKKLKISRVRYSPRESRTFLVMNK